MFAGSPISVSGREHPMGIARRVEAAMSSLDATAGESVTGHISPSVELERPSPTLPATSLDATTGSAWRRGFAVPVVTTEAALYAICIAFAFTLRIWDVGSRAMHGDEAVHAWLAWNLFKGTGYAYDPVYHGPLQFPVTALFFFLFGVSNVSGRLMSVLFGTALVGLPYYLRHWMGRGSALCAAALIAIAPSFVYTSRLERDDMFTCLFAMTMAIALFSYVATRRPRYLYLGTASIALSLSAMENTYITLFIFGTFVLIVLFWEKAPKVQAAQRFLLKAGSIDRIAGWALGVYAVVLILAFALTVTTGWYLPVPLLLGIGLLGLVSRQVSWNVHASGETPFVDAVRSPSREQWLNALTIVVAILFLLFSTFGTNLHGIWDSSQGILNNGCSYNKFPLNPCRRDIVGGLFYWLSQHEVHRGGQPWFYYTLLFGLYEQIAVVFGLASIVWFARRPTLFTTFLTYWAVLAFGIYSWAGEKFPWLMVHSLLPFTLLAAMFIVEMLSRAGAVRWFAGAILAILVVLELHSMYEVNFVNGADPVEMMVYVQSAPDTPAVANNILSISNKVTGGDDLHVSIDTDDTWPFAWYLRDMPNVGYPSESQLLKPPFSTNPVIIVDDAHQAALAPLLKNQYVGRHYILRWWFPEDYKALTWSSAARDIVKPGTWNVVFKWLIERRPFGPKGNVSFYYYVKRGLVSPF